MSPKQRWGVAVAIVIGVAFSVLLMMRAAELMGSGVLSSR